MSLPEGAVIITPNEMYREMQAIAKNVDRLATILDPSLAQLRVDLIETGQRIVVVDTKAAALDNRVRVLENWRWMVLGIATVIAPAGGFLLTYLFGRGA